MLTPDEQRQMAIQAQLMQLVQKPRNAGYMYGDNPNNKNDVAALLEKTLNSEQYVTPYEPSATQDYRHWLGDKTQKLATGLGASEKTGEVIRRQFAGTPDKMGAADLVPFVGEGLGFQDAGRIMDQGELMRSSGDFWRGLGVEALGAGVAGATVAGMVGPVKIVAKPLARVLKNVSGDLASGANKGDELLEAVIANPETLSRLPTTPLNRPKPLKIIHDAHRSYMERKGLPPVTPNTYVDATPETSSKVALAFENMKHSPNDPIVLKSYNKLVEETLDQYQTIKDTGLKIEFIPDGAADPYSSPSKLLADIKDNNHLWVFPTSDGFGTLNAIKDNPLLGMTKEVVGGKQLQANDVFRIVHDYFGHGLEGASFGARGEENAWLSHSGMYSKEALGAMTTETRGQNSWVNFGPHGKANRANQRNTIYADQKIGLMPDWTTQTPRGVKYEENYAGRIRGKETEGYGPVGQGADSKPTTGRGVQQVPRPISKPTIQKGQIELTHYSPKANLQEIDPSKGGSNFSIRGGERERSMYKSHVPKSFWGIDMNASGGYTKEYGVGENQYKTKIDADKLYDLKTDPNNYYFEAESKFPDNDIERLNYLDQIIKNDGFSGYWKNAPSGMVGVLFDKIKVGNLNYGDELVEAISLQNMMKAPTQRFNINMGKKATKLELDPLGYQKRNIKEGYLSDFDVQQTDLGEVNPRFDADVEMMEGGIIIPLFGDRSSTGKNITGIGDITFDKPLNPDGGIDFMLGQSAQADRALWASAPHIMNNIYNQARRLADKTGKDIYGVHVGMGPDGVDFATFAGESMAELMKFAPVKKADALKADEFMKLRDPNWIGVKHPDLRDYISTVKPEVRKSFIRYMDTAPAQAAGFPSPAIARKAVTDVTQFGQATGSAGMATGKIDIDGLIDNPTVPHSTYIQQGTGKYTGQLPQSTAEELWPDDFAVMNKQVDKNRKPLTESMKLYSLKTRLGPQEVTPELVDMLMRKREPRQ